MRQVLSARVDNLTWKGRWPDMGQHKSIHVTQRSDGWAVKPAGHQRATVIKPTQAAAEEAAKQMARERGGSEVITHGRNGLFRSSDTIAKADPNPPKDREH